MQPERASVLSYLRTWLPLGECSLFQEEEVPGLRRVRSGVCLFIEKDTEWVLTL